jgi:hypothetical protein
MNTNTHETQDQKSANRTRGISAEADAQLSKLRKAGKSVGEEIGAYVHKQPIAAVGIAAGAGFALGSVFGSRLGRFLLVAASGYVVQGLLDEVLGEGGVKKILVTEISKLAQVERGPR